MLDYKPIKDASARIRKIIGYSDADILTKSETENLLNATEQVNLFLYQVKKLKFQREYDLTIEENRREALSEIKQLLEIWDKTIFRNECSKEIDRRFWKIYEKFKYVLPDDIYLETMQRFFALPQEWQLEYLSLGRRYTFLSGAIDITKDDFSLIIQHIEMMAKNVEKFRWLYENLEDYRSKHTLVGVIEYWFDFDINKLHTVTETVYKDYYDLDIVECDEKEVVVDLGAYTGDSILDFIDVYGKYKHIYAYEISPDTYKILKNNLSEYDDVECRRKGVSAKKGVMYMDDTKGAGNAIKDSGSIEVEVVSLDEDIDERITMIKMDIEGAEKDAIIGSQKHIKEEKPKLLISSYHIPEDIFDIPLLINEIRDDYKLYMRFNGKGIWPCDYVLFAV